jgi:hypothetical protein
MITMYPFFMDKKNVAGVFFGAPEKQVCSAQVSDQMIAR